MLRSLALACLSFVALPAAAQAARPATLPTLTRSLIAPVAARHDCATTTAKRGVTRARYVAPMSGFVTARLGSARGDWDLVARDVASRRNVATSQGFGSNEVVQAWARAGQRIDFIACRRKGTDRTARLRIAFVDVTPPKSLGTVSLVRVRGDALKIPQLEKAGLDVTHERGQDFADVLVAGDAQRNLIARSGLDATTRVADMTAFGRKSDATDARGAAAGTRSALPSGRETYRTYEDVQTELKALVEKHPDSVRPVVIGKTFQGRDIQGVEIADNVNANDGRPVYFLMGLHHAREWPSEEAAIEYATMLADPAAEPRVAALRANERTLIVPVVNVDGFVTTRQDSAVDPNDNNPAGQDPNVHLGEAVAPPGGILAYRRKNCDGEIPNPNVPCELQWGIDNNRNYGNLWGGPGSSQDPTSQSFHGPGPRSEPETQAVWNFARTHQVTMLMTLHNVAALVLRPPGLHDGGKAPDENRMKEIGDAMGAATGYTSEYGFQLYDTAGTTEDDSYAATGGYGYTIEMGRAPGHPAGVRLQPLRPRRHDRGRQLRRDRRLRLHDRDGPVRRHVPRALPAGRHRPVGARRHGLQRGWPARRPDHRRRGRGQPGRPRGHLGQRTQGRDAAPVEVVRHEDEPVLRAGRGPGRLGHGAARCAVVPGRRPGPADAARHARRDHGRSGVRQVRVAHQPVDAP